VRDDNDLLFWSRHCQLAYCKQAGLCVLRKPKLY
jgi:hypothetical protein